jgi:hypothetical protein
MTPKLTWDDLLIQSISPETAATCLAMWSPLVQGRVAPVFMSKFGDWFLRRPDGSTAELSVIEGTFNTIARTPEEFSGCVNMQEWQEVHLLSRQVHELHQRGLVPGPGQCYAFAPHPTFSGRIDLARVMLMGIPVWQSICAQLFAAGPTAIAEPPIKPARSIGKSIFLRKAESLPFSELRGGNSGLVFR